MRKGDISNDMPKRVLVIDSLVFIKTQKIEKKYKFLPTVKTFVSYDKVMLNKFYQYTTKRGVTLELISFELNQEELDLSYNEIERAGTNPFRYCTAYKSPKKLIEDLPFRPEVIGVFDPERQLMYGHWGLDL